MEEKANNDKPTNKRIYDIFVIVLFVMLSIGIINFHFSTALVQRPNTIEPLLNIKNETLQRISVAVPVILIIWVSLMIKNPFHDYRKVLVVGFFSTITILALITMPNFDIKTNFPERVQPLEQTTTTTTTTVAGISGIQAGLIDMSSFYSTAYGLAEFIFFLLSFILIVILTIRLVVLSRSSSSNIKAVNIDEENTSAYSKSVDIDKKVLDIKKWYYTTSSFLEKRGADDSPHLTPEEFVIDVLNKKLCNQTIDDFIDLSLLFEEAKFSNHSFSDEDLEKAKKIAMTIINEGKNRNKGKNKETDDNE